MGESSIQFNREYVYFLFSVQDSGLSVWLLNIFIKKWYSSTAPFWPSVVKMAAIQLRRLWIMNWQASWKSMAGTFISCLPTLVLLERKPCHLTNMSRQIIDDNFLHALRIFRDHETKSVRIQASVHQGELEKYAAAPVLDSAYPAPQSKH